MKDQTVMIKLKNKEKIESIGLFVQFVLLIAIIILAICCLFIPVLNVALQALMVCLLLTMSYNNYSIFRRKGFTVLYALAGVAILVVSLVGYFYEK